jgi:hypothetical protein
VGVSASIAFASAALTVEGDCFVGVQLHLGLDLLRCAVGDVDADPRACPVSTAVDALAPPMMTWVIDLSQ